MYRPGTTRHAATKERPLPTTGSDSIAVWIGALADPSAQIQRQLGPEAEQARGPLSAAAAIPDRESIPQQLTGDRAGIAAELSGDRPTAQPE